MSVNPQLLPHGMPVAFYNELFVLARDAVEFHVDKIPGKPNGNFFAFDMPVLYTHGEKFNQPIFHCNSVSGFVEPVVQDNAHRALYSTHSFKIMFKEGCCGTFVPLFFNLLKSLRQYNQQSRGGAEAPRIVPIEATPPPVEERSYKNITCSSLVRSLN